MENIELKVRAPELSAVRARILYLGAEYQWRRVQTDTYFQVSGGRLKLRVNDGASDGILIGYSRPDDHSSRISQYRLLPVPDAATLRLMLDEALGILAVVSKARELYLFGNTRIHLDDVNDLGSFVELETVISNQSLDAAWNEHRHVRKVLALDEFEPVPFSYSDLVRSDRPDR